MRRGRGTPLRPTNANLDCVLGENALVFTVPTIGGVQGFLYDRFDQLSLELEYLQVVLKMKVP